MREFDIVIRSLKEVQAFVNLAMVQPFEVIVGNETQYINGKDLMGMFSLDYCHPLHVPVTCSEEEFFDFRAQTAQLLSH